jgi:hypothetical protein
MRMMKRHDEKRSESITVWVRPGVKAALSEISAKTGKPVTELVRGSLKTIHVTKDGLKRHEAD